MSLCAASAALINWPLPKSFGFGYAFGQTYILLWLVYRKIKFLGEARRGEKPFSFVVQKLILQIQEKKWWWLSYSYWVARESLCCFMEPVFSSTTFPISLPFDLSGDSSILNHSLSLIFPVISQIFYSFLLSDFLFSKPDELLVKIVLFRRC